MGIYEEILSRDIISKLGPAMGGAGYQIDVETGLLTCPEYIGYEIPWIVTKPPKGMHCRMLFSILFKIFGKELGAPPIRCQSCWKVVVKPKTVVDLMKLMWLQEGFKDDDRIYGCKCGIEKRTYVNGLYGGYFYNRTLEEGHECYEIVKDAVDEQLGDDTKVILKRGCTEFEMQYGDSQDWKIGERQQHFEETIMGCFAPEKEAAEPSSYRSRCAAHIPASGC